MIKGDESQKKVAATTDVLSPTPSSISLKLPCIIDLIETVIPIIKVVVAAQTIMDMVTLAILLLLVIRCIKETLMLCVINASARKHRGILLVGWLPE